MHRQDPLRLHAGIRLQHPNPKPFRILPLKQPFDRSSNCSLQTIDTGRASGWRLILVRITPHVLTARSIEDLHVVVKIYPDHNTNLELSPLPIQNDKVGQDSTKASIATASVIASGALALLKLLVGSLSGSLGLLAEAAHSLLDLLSTLITVLVVRVAALPPDSNHPYGHEK